MLNYNFSRIFKARAIDKPFAFLKANGFSDHFAAKINQNRVSLIRNRELEKLCLILRCTPNDLLEWTDDKGYDIDDAHPMCKLLKIEVTSDMSRTINAIPLEKMEEINKMIKDKLKDYDA